LGRRRRHPDAGRLHPGRPPLPLRHPEVAAMAARAPRPVWAGAFVLPGRSCCGGATRVAARATLSAARSASASLAVSDVDVQRPAMTTISHARAFDAPPPAPAPPPPAPLAWGGGRVRLA